MGADRWGGRVSLCILKIQTRKTSILILIVLILIVLVLILILILMLVASMLVCVLSEEIEVGRVSK